MEQIQARVQKEEVTKIRDDRIDNCKGFLIILVILGHLLGNIFTRTSIGNILWVVINAFHMPAFLMLSGYLSRGRIARRAYEKAVTGCFIPYLFAQGGLFLMLALTGTAKEFSAGGSPNQLIWLKPMGALWYIFAVGVYLIITPLLEDLLKKRERVWVLALLAALFMGYCHTVGYLRFTKLVTYYVYFLTGYLGAASKEHGKSPAVPLPRWAWGGLAAGLSILVGAVYWFKLRGRGVVNGLITMDDNGQYVAHLKNTGLNPLIFGPPLRLAIILLGILIGIGLIMSMTGRKTPLAYLGRYSVYPYVMHWFGLRVIQILLAKYPEGRLPLLITALNTNRGLIVVVVFSITLAFLLASKPVRAVLRPFLEPDLDLSRLFQLIRKA